MMIPPTIGWQGALQSIVSNGLPDTNMQQREVPAMKFTTSSVVAPQEARLGRLASAGLSGSVVLLGAFLIFVGASVTGTWWAAAAASAMLVAYLIQVHYLSTIGRHPAERRLRTWSLSLAAHGIVFAVCYLVIRDSVIFALLIPEALSALIHLAGIRSALKTRDSA
jgi:hypothetical protein